MIDSVYAPSLCGLAASLLALACGPSPPATQATQATQATGRIVKETPSSKPMEHRGTDPSADGRYAHRTRMVRQQLEGRDIHDIFVLDAMRKVPRHAFVSAALASDAYSDRPLPIGQGQTISQPYIVALMTQLARPKGAERVLDVGTGSGYQAAVLAELADNVYGIEILCDHATSAHQRLRQLGYTNATVRCGDGFHGWPEFAPFDAIIVAAAPKEVPPALLSQLKPEGRLVIPVGGQHQELRLYIKGRDGGVTVQHVAPVRFVPFVRKAADAGP